MLGADGGRCVRSGSRVCARHYLSVGKGRYVDCMGGDRR
jgi:hypothetical protein